MAIRDGLRLVAIAAGSGMPILMLTAADQLASIGDRRLPTSAAASTGRPPGTDDPRPGLGNATADTAPGNDQEAGPMPSGSADEPVRTTILPGALVDRHFEHPDPTLRPALFAYVFPRNQPSRRALEKN